MLSSQEFMILAYNIVLVYIKDFGFNGLSNPMNVESFVRYLSNNTKFEYVECKNVIEYVIYMLTEPE